ncbi:hypothetical protein IWQ62_000289 [Dispira parvispora]|uniref:SCP domain-containing protein n=1 Tax=Dispira parvispora TaxID=1520584 RepID=A0A9W8E679_9FUNG|nr:hypothetical protein IWQ62_000289 [Dispira parvispora]
MRTLTWCLILLTAGYSLAQPYAGRSSMDPNKMLALVNDARKQSNASPLSYNDALNKDAKHHSQYQSSIGSMTHDDSKGDTMSRLQQDGLQASATGENVAYNQPDVDSVMDSWLNSPGHRANILNPSYTHLGAANVNGYWTQVFAGLEGSAGGYQNQSPGHSGTEKHAQQQGEEGENVGGRSAGGKQRPGINTSGLGVGLDSYTRPSLWGSSINTPSI